MPSRSRSSSPPPRRSRSRSYSGERYKGGSDERPRSRSPAPRGRSPSPRGNRSPASRSPPPHGDRSPRSRSPPPRHRSPSRSPPPRRRGGPPDRSWGNRPNREDPEPSKCLGVFGLSLYTTERDLDKEFRKFGPMEKIQVVMDGFSGKSRGFAFVYFESIDDATEARDAMNGVELDRKKIRVDYSITKRAHTPTPGSYAGRPTSGRERDSRGSRGGYGGGRGYGGGYDRDRGYGGSRGGGYGGDRGYGGGRSRDDYYRRGGSPGGDRYRRRSPSPGAHYRKRSPSPYRERPMKRSRSPDYHDRPAKREYRSRSFSPGRRH